jgi:hypothetical protein
MLVTDLITVHSYTGASDALIPVSVFQIHMQLKTEYLVMEQF